MDAALLFSNVALQFYFHWQHQNAQIFRLSIFKRKHRLKRGSWIEPRWSYNQCAPLHRQVPWNLLSVYCLWSVYWQTIEGQGTGRQLKVSVLADNWRSVYWLTIEVFLADCGKSKHTIHKILPQLPPVWTHSILRICSRVLVTWQVKMVGCICDLECHGMLALAWAPELSGSSERPWRKYGEKPAFLTFIDPWLDKTENRTRKQMWSHRNIC